LVIRKFDKGAHGLSIGDECIGVWHIGKMELTISNLCMLSEILNVSHILNFDATKAFANSHRDAADEGAQEEQVIDHDQYFEKYIALLEKEIELLQK
jgi:hypothetical protein